MDDNLDLMVHAGDREKECDYIVVWAKNNWAFKVITLTEHFGYMCKCAGDFNPICEQYATGSLEVSENEKSVFDLVLSKLQGIETKNIVGRACEDVVWAMNEASSALGDIKAENLHALLERVAQLRNYSPGVV